MRIVFQSCRRVFLALALSALFLTTPRAEDWPSRPITIVVGFAAGTTIDLVARVIAGELSTTLGQPVVVENKPGGGGVIATASVARAQPDGYTLLMTAIGPAVLRPLIDNKLSYNADKDFTPIALIGDNPIVIVTNQKGPLATIKDIIDYAKANPGKLTMGHSGPGTMGHLAAVLFANEAGIEANFVAYQGSPLIIGDVVGGHLDAGSVVYGPSVQAAKIIAAATDQRISFLPDIPTMSESGLPNVVGTTWHAMLAPVGLPSAIVSKLNASVNKIIEKPAFKEQFEKDGYHIIGGSPARLAKQMVDDRAKWSKVIEKAHLSQN